MFWGFVRRIALKFSADSRVFADVFERMLRLHVTPPSGDGTTSFVLREFSRVRELNKLAKSSLGKSSFGKGVLRLVTSEGHFLDDLDETPRKQLCQTEQLSC